MSLVVVSPALSVQNKKRALVQRYPLCDQFPVLLSQLVSSGVAGCKCDTKGTISGIAECQQGDGQCFCKPNICGQFCSTCKDGYFNMENANYFGCQAQQVTVLPLFPRPAQDHYFPDLHHLKFELEEGTTPAGRAVRFGYNPLEFEGFSWRGYAQMSSIQPKVVVTLNVTSPDLFRLVFRYVSRGPASVEGRVSVVEEGKFNVCGNCVPIPGVPVSGGWPEPSQGVSREGEEAGRQNKIRVTVDVKEAELYLFHVILRYINSGGATVYGKITAYQPRRRGTEQTKQIVFAPSTEPAFVTVPQNSFGEPFVLNPNTWSLVIEAEGVLLDYLVLLPSSYYEAPILQLKVTEPCTYQPAPEQATQNCLLYKYLSVEGFPATAGVEAVCRLDNRLPRVCPTEQLTPSHPRMATCSGSDVEVQLSLPVPQPGKYVLVVEYANTNALQTVGIAVSSPHLAMQQGTFIFYPCVYSFLCRGIAVDSQSRMATFELTSEATVQFTSDLADFFLAAVVFNSRIQTLGRYAFILHYYQPNHPAFPVEVLINGGRIWQGQTTATFCPHGYGCRSLVVSEDQIVLDVTDNDLTVVVRVPEGKRLWLDYILVVPEDSYSSQYLQEEPLDKSYDFISSCGVNSFYINPSTSSRFCRDSAISLSLFYNNGAQPCRCHEAGARGSQCEPFGGQCPCKPNVIGRECSRCATGYWGFPNCRPCDCGTRLCDEVTGQCICPPHTLKPECVVCEPQTFGCHPLIGCEDCNCSRPGVQELTEPGCDVDSGQCRCKPNIIGRQCDLCAPGYYHYPNCRRCDCHQAGTEASVCDPVTGQCHCKENVEGPRCDQCRLGTFSLDASNPKGCTKCFCFGATDRCRSAEKHRAEFVDMNGWLLLSSDRQEVPTTLSLREQLVRADLKNLPDAYQELYWVAPSSYLGDQVSSYGGHLRYELHSDPRRGDVFIPMESRPDVILKGNQMSIMFLEGAYPSPGEVHEGQLQLVESNFRHTETHNPVSREELMMVLANLEQLQIRALFSQLSSSVSLRRVVLEMATDTATGIRASNVELCFCPANYQGDSCQECAPGYYRDTKGLFLGKCIPCHCNGHSDQCLPGSGICLNCQHNTEGDHCERCKDGYVGSRSAEEPLQCVGCPCPLSVASNNFAVGCVHKGSNMQCLCKPGYAGPSCERCAPGYYGNPLVIGSSCQPCDCSGNTDPNMLFSSCDSLTGACTGCMHHTAGARCEVCAPGYYGDAVVAKNCTKCHCSPCGTDSCHPRTGQCVCKTGVTGQHCDRCEEGYYGFEGCSGCRRCDCDIGAVGSSCHAQTGQCSCLPGVNLVRQMARFGAANASTTSTEEFRQKMAEVERMLREMKERSLGSQEELARHEHEEAQKLLHRVKSELHARWESNQDLVASIRDRLAQHSSQLMDLRDALNEAVNKTRQTEDLNSLNRNNLEESQQKSRELQKQHALVQETLRMAKESLAQVSDFLQKMESAKEAYEKLAALLDGAKLPLTERVKKFSPASSKIPIVEQAEEHARLLDELARNLSSIIQGTNQDGFIQRAIDASNAYASIIEAVKKAERAAHDADEAASEALMSVISENLGAISKELKRNSSNLEEAVRREQRKLSEAITGTLQTAKDKLADLRAKKEQLLSQLQSVQDMLGRDQEDTKETIQNAKAAAAEANETAARVEDTLSTMKKNLNEWKDQYGGLRKEDLNQAVQDARKSVSSLESTIPLLLGKLSSLENRRNKNATVSENIVRIRQLITQARNAASKVKVPMKFNGSSGVQVRMPTNLQDLAAYTSLKFYIQNPEPRSRQRRQDGAEEGRFVLYLGSREATGDYLGIVLKDRKVHWIYKLGDEEPASLTVDEDIGEQFATISINRILQYGQMSVIVERQTVHETKGDSVAKGEQGLLNLDPRNVVFYVGGYPSSFTPPPTLRYPNYRGCLELDTLNEEVVSLYNFQRTFQLDTTAEKPCARSKSTGDPWLTDGSYFDGTGYAEIKFESQFGTTKRFEQEIRVVSYNGILFFLENQGQFLCLAIRDGKLVLYYDFSTGLEMAKPSSNSSSLTISSTTNKAIQIFLLKMNNKKRILVRLERLTIFMVEQENSLENAVSYYLGGVPPAVLPPSLKALFPTGGPIRGCMKGLKALGKYVDLKRMSTVGVSYGCTSDLLVARSVSVHGHGYLTLALKDVSGLRDFYSGFSFRTSQREGLLYHHTTQEGTCRVSLQRGQLALNLLETEVTTENAYADDRTHYVAFYSDAHGVRLYVDDELQDTTASTGASRRQRRQDGRLLFQLGGSPEPGALSNLTGCIGNVFVKRTTEPQMVVDLQQNVESINVTMSCPWGGQPQQLRVTPKKGRRKPKVLGRPASKDRRHDRDGLCRLHPQPRAAGGTFRFGGAPSSRWEFEEIPASFGRRSHFSLEVKLNSSNGLLFYVAGERGTLMALFVSNGRFVFLLDVGGRRLRIRSKDKYRDRRWHTVFFSRDQSRAQLVIDGLRAQGVAVATAGLFVARTPLYVGGVPAGKAKAHIPVASASSFDGCLRNPQLDGRPLGAPSRTFGVTPCYEGALESGVFFAADGGSIVLADAVVTEQDLEVTLEVRPRSASGLIFHIGTRRSHHLLLYMEETKVTVRANVGADEFSASVTCPSLCDGQWHSIAAPLPPHIFT
ncbi:laminin subunit alpha-5 [Limosa lapponica baueri]|uniref:Laminin subunit alpha-5 n=1 Tax=Limosa lapponica baueri TaxID=1758121 RepID=A0A2I0TR25_LIMLA|nr:laminin subunit alpha-5 [Limosa lapponica baueri]